MLSFDTVVIVIHVVATLVGFVLGWGWINGFVSLVTNVLVNFGLASAALRGHQSFAIDLGLIGLGFVLMLFMRWYQQLQR